MLSSRQYIWHKEGGEEAKPTIAELKIHDCTRSSHMTALIEEIIWSTGGIMVDDHGYVLEQHPSLIFPPSLHAMFMSMP